MGCLAYLDIFPFEENILWLPLECHRRLRGASEVVSTPPWLFMGS
jgi:hypothetical protein